MGRRVTRRLTQADLDYSLLRLPMKESNLFPDSQFTLLCDDGSEIQTTYDKRNNRLTSRGAMQRYYENKGLSVGDLLIIEEVDPKSKYSLTSKKSPELPAFQETDLSTVTEERWTSFALEEDLRHFLVRNLERLEVGLNLYQDKEGREGEEYHTPIGDIDILAVDANGDYVVIELKVSRGSDATVGQLLRYVGWVQRHLAAGKKVRGIILANEMDEKLKYAAGATLNLALFEYEISFRLRPSKV